MKSLLLILALIVSNVSFAVVKCIPDSYEMEVGILTQTCDNKFLVNDIPLSTYLNEQSKRRKTMTEQEIKALGDLMDTVRFLDKRWKDQQKKGK